jgi:excisionase family DNA binding protein
MPAIPALTKLAYSINEVIYLTGLSRTTLYKLIKERKLSTVLVAGRRLVPQSSLSSLLSTEAA